MATAITRCYDLAMIDPDANAGEEWRGLAQ
jgi:hypothetical protein